MTAMSAKPMKSDDRLPTKVVGEEARGRDAEWHQAIG